MLNGTVEPSRRAEGGGSAAGRTLRGFQGVAAVGIFNSASQLVLEDVLITEPSLQLPATVAAAEGGAVSVRGGTYKVRQVLDQPPDGALRVLVLAKV